jgi:2-methylisocitrate lyase-like PEP mutase family enzyme
MIEGLAKLEDIEQIRGELGDEFKHTVNLIAGGKTPPVTLTKLSELKVNIVIYSTPCLYAAQKAIEDSMLELKEMDGSMELKPGAILLEANMAIMKNNAKNAI